MIEAEKSRIVEQQRAFDHAELTKDLEWLKQHLSEDFQAIGPRRFVLDKSAFIDRHRHFNYEKLESSEVDVRLYESAAVVRAVQSNRAVYQGEPLEHRVRISEVWVSSDAGWNLAALQFSPMAS